MCVCVYLAGCKVLILVLVRVCVCGGGSGFKKKEMCCVVMATVHTRSHSEPGVRGLIWPDHAGSLQLRLHAAHRLGSGAALIFLFLPPPAVPLNTTQICPKLLFVQRSPLVWQHHFLARKPLK